MLSGRAGEEKRRVWRWLRQGVGRKAAAIA